MRAPKAAFVLRLAVGGVHIRSARDYAPGAIAASVFLPASLSLYNLRALYGGIV